MAFEQMLLYLPRFKVVLRFPYKLPVIYKEQLGSTEKLGELEI